MIAYRHLGHLRTDSLYDARPFMAEHNRPVRHGPIAVQHVKVGVADAARLHPDENLVTRGCRQIERLPNQRLIHTHEHHRIDRRHSTFSPAWLELNVSL